MILGIVAVMAGATIIRDWGGWGTRSYRFTTRLPLPGSGFYRHWGFGTFRALVGGGYVVVGLIFIVVTAIGLTVR